jgi:hypothetical protein
MTGSFPNSACSQDRLGFGCGLVELPREGDSVLVSVGAGEGDEHFVVTVFVSFLDAPGAWWVAVFESLARRPSSVRAVIGAAQRGSVAVQFHEPSVDELMIVVAGVGEIQVPRTVRGCGHECKLAAAMFRPVLFYPAGASCWQPCVKGYRMMTNSIFNGWRMEDVWLDR